MPWRILDENTTTGAIVDAVNGATQVVNAEFFGFVDAGKGAQLVQALEGAARRGVEVNVVTDFISSTVLPPGSWHRMRRKVEDAGGTVILTSRIPFTPRTREHPGLRHVDHRKLVTVDGTTGFVGGMNYMPFTDGYEDTMAQVSGVAAARLAADQLDRWARVGGTVTDRHRRTVADALGDAPLRPTDQRELAIIANAPEQDRFELTDAYRDMIRGAKERVWVASPGISDRDMIDELHAAASRGVDVRLIAGEKPPIAPPVGWVARAHMNELLAAGGSAYETPGTLHRKALVVDDEAVLSSYNLTKRSANADHEVGIRTKDPAFVQAIAGLLQHDMDRSARYDSAKLSGIGKLVGTTFAKYLSY